MALTMFDTLQGILERLAVSTGLEASVDVYDDLKSNSRKWSLVVGDEKFFIYERDYHDLTTINTEELVADITRRMLKAKLRILFPDVSTILDKQKGFE